MTTLDKIAEAIEFHAESAGAVYFDGKAAARAALTAMMEPSDDVLSAGWDRMPGYDPEPSDVGPVFQAVIQAILNEGSEK